MAVDYPKTRMDNFYAKAAGSDMADTSMKPITDREYWINELAARLAEGGLVPPIEAGDDGKVLTASDGEAAWESAGGGLPEITESDEGKVLTVDEGEAVWASGGGGSSDVVFISDNDGLSASWNELRGYFNTNKIVILPYSYEEDGEMYCVYQFLTVLNLNPDTGNYEAHFSTAQVVGDEQSLFVLKYASNDPDGVLYQA